MLRGGYSSYTMSVNEVYRSLEQKCDQINQIYQNLNNIANNATESIRSQWNASYFTVESIVKNTDGLKANFCYTIIPQLRENELLDDSSIQHLMNASGSYIDKRLKNIINKLSELVDYMLPKSGQDKTEERVTLAKFDENVRIMKMDMEEITYKINQTNQEIQIIEAEKCNSKTPSNNIFSCCFGICCLALLAIGAVYLAYG